MPETYDLIVRNGTLIDAHTHDDRLMLSAPQMAPKVSQGVTTVVAGNCALLVGHTTLRVAVLDDLERPASRAEIERMRDEGERIMDSLEPARGIDSVVVNGAVAWRHGKDTGARAGRILARAP